MIPNKKNPRFNYCNHEWVQHNKIWYPFIQSSNYLLCLCLTKIEVFRASFLNDEVLDVSDKEWAARQYWWWEGRWLGQVRYGGIHRSNASLRPRDGTPSVYVWPSPRQTPDPRCPYSPDRTPHDATMKPWTPPRHGQTRGISARKKIRWAWSLDIWRVVTVAQFWRNGQTSASDSEQ